MRTQVPLSALNFMDIDTIRKAIKDPSPKGGRLIEILVAQSLRTVLEMVQAFVGDPIGTRGTMGNPVILQRDNYPDIIA